MVKFPPLLIGFQEAHVLKQRQLKMYMSCLIQALGKLLLGYFGVVIPAKCLGVNTSC